MSVVGQFQFCFGGGWLLFCRGNWKDISPARHWGGEDWEPQFFGCRNWEERVSFTAGRKQNWWWAAERFGFGRSKMEFSLKSFPVKKILDVSSLLVVQTFSKRWNFSHKGILFSCQFYYYCWVMHRSTLRHTVLGSLAAVFPLHMKTMP